MPDLTPTLLDRTGIHVVYAALLANLLAGHGIAPPALLAGTGIDPARLHAIDGRLSARQYMTLIANARQLSGDPSLAFQLGLQLKLSTHGFLGFAALSAATLGDALELGVKYCRTRIEFMDLRYARQPEAGVLEIVEAVPMGEAFAFLLEAIFTGIGVMSLNLLGEVPADIQVRRTGPRPPWYDRVHQHFQMRYRVQFDDTVNQILIPEAHLQRPLLLSDPVARQLAEAQCQKELQTIQGQDDVVYRVSRLLKDCGGVWPRLEQVAGQLHLSPRTLKRRLLAADTSFQVLLDQVRLEQARLLLCETRQSVDTIATSVGYRDASNFNRAFRRWLGVTPAAFRRQQQAPLPSSRED